MKQPDGKFKQALHGVQIYIFISGYQVLYLLVMLGFLDPKFEELFDKWRDLWAIITNLLFK